MDYKKEVPERFRCPLTDEIMEEPWLMEDKKTYERKNIEDYMKKNNNISMFTKKEMSPKGVLNKELKEEMNNYFNRITVFLKNLAGKTFTLVLFKTDTVQKLKETVQDKTGVPIDTQRLMLTNGKQLNNNYETLMANNIENNSMVHLLLRLRAG